ncbi:MAG: MogA/MoaB family molybdenum cofactor biosynthesis protein [Candidatus Dormibacteria bacterium]|jgi:molybdenum cofactor synthesis domain-containing protein
MMSWRAAVITVSDSRGRGETTHDPSGDLIVARLAELPADITDRRLVPDEVEAIRAALGAVLARAHLVVLSGGTGLGPRDVTPQAISPLLDYEVPGMAEAMRREGLRNTPHAMLSRQVVGVSQGRLVIALPGSPAAVDQGLRTVWKALPHALRLLAGDTAHGGTSPPDVGHLDPS